VVTWGRRLVADEAEFGSVEQLPVDFFASRQADGGGQGDGQVDVEALFCAFGADGLNF
jgi:hypothetical protein